METFTVSIVNEHFESTDEIRATDELAALQQSLKGALAIAAEQVAVGKPFFGAEVTLSRGKKRLSRMVVSVGASPLKA